MSEVKVKNSFNYLDFKSHERREDIYSTSTLSASPKRISRLAQKELDKITLSKPLNCPNLHLKTIRILEKNIIKKEDHSYFKQNILNTCLNHLQSPEIFNDNNLKIQASFRCKSKIFTLCYYSPIQKQE